MIRADLHIHTYYSDGLQSPRDVVETAVKNGVGLISVTDHDNALGRKEVGKLAKEAGIYAVEGIEISAYEGDVKVHTLGYGLDFDSPVFEKFHSQCLAASEERMADIIKKLQGAGVDLTMDEVRRERRDGRSPLHTMLAAYAAVKKGLAEKPGDFYMRYLSYGKAGYSNIGRPTPKEAVEVIKECGGISSIAHPGRIFGPQEYVTDLIKRMKGYGLDGIEAMYSEHTDLQTQYYKELAEELGLLVTGGSDTHFTDGPHYIGTPVFYPDGALLSALGIIEKQ